MVAVEAVGPLIRDTLFCGRHYPLTAHSTHVRRELHLGQGLARCSVLVRETEWWVRARKCWPKSEEDGLIQHLSKFSQSTLFPCRLQGCRLQGCRLQGCRLQGVGYRGVGYRGVGYWGVGYRGVGYWGVGYRGVGYRGVGYRLQECRLQGCRLLG